MKEINVEQQRLLEKLREDVKNILWLKAAVKKSKYQTAMEITSAPFCINQISNQQKFQYFLICTEVGLFEDAHWMMIYFAKNFLKCFKLP